MRTWVVALALSLAAATAAEAAGPEYDLTWTTFAREARWRNGEAQPVAAGERSGRAVARLTRVQPGVLRLDWSGEGGDGSGLIGPAGPTRFTFPSPLVIAGPPPLPHLSGGSFEFSGDPERPESFEVSYVEGFICRSTPAVCSGVQMWERRFDGRATRVEERHGSAGALPSVGGAWGVLSRPPISMDARDGGGHAPGQLARRERLEHDALHAALGGLFHHLAGAVGGDHHHAQPRAQRPRALDELDAVQLRHLVVHHQEIGRLGLQVGQRLRHAGEAVHRVPLRLEHPPAHQHDGRLVVDDDDVHAASRRASARSLYSTESTSACQEASMMLSATPTVPQVSRPSPEVISTRVLAAVPLDSSRMRTL